MEYTKPWLSLDQQLELLARRGVIIDDHDRATSLLRAIGYYRLTGYLYPFRESEEYIDDNGDTRKRVLDGYRPGTTLQHAEEIIDFDRRLRLLVLDGIERIEIAVRMQVGYVLGRLSAFAYEDPSYFNGSFAENHAEWLERVRKRKDGSDEQFVAHFRNKYDDRMPIWALTEILELGQLSVLYRGLKADCAAEIAEAFGVPTKRVMASWLASLNYVRNVAAHHGRLFNRKLQYSPKRPPKGAIPLLDHLRSERPKVFGTYDALAVIAYLLLSIDLPSTDPRGTGWRSRMVTLLQEFPTSHALTIQSIGVPEKWESLDLWRS